MQYARAEPYYPTLARKEASALVMSEDGIRSAVDSFKLIGLLIPPANRRKLQVKQSLRIRFPRAFSAWRCDFLLLTLIKQYQGK